MWSRRENLSATHKRTTSCSTSSRTWPWRTARPCPWRTRGRRQWIETRRWSCTRPTHPRTAAANAQFFDPFPKTAAVYYLVWKRCKNKFKKERNNIASDYACVDEAIIYRIQPADQPKPTTPPPIIILIISQTIQRVNIPKYLVIIHAFPLHWAGSWHWTLHSLNQNQFKLFLFF